MSLLKRLGLDRHAVKEIAHNHGLRHTEACREWNRHHIEGANLYTCKCDFFMRVGAAVFAEVFAFGPPCRCGGATMEQDDVAGLTVYYACRDCGWTFC